MPIILYKLDSSPPARTVFITAEILGLDIETRELDIFNNEHLSPEYLKKNPVHTIPLLEDGDFVLSDSHAIAIYLISKYGGPQAGGLYPSDVRERASVNEKLFLDASILFPRLLSMARDVMREGAISIDEKKEAGVEEAYGFMEKYLERSPFIAGKNITIADVACVTTVSSLNLMVPIDERYQKLRAWLKVLSNEKWYQTKNQPGLNDFGLKFAAQLQKNAE